MSFKITVTYTVSFCTKVIGKEIVHVQIDLQSVLARLQV